MKIIEPKAELFDFVDTEAVMKKLELCGRVSHQSEPREGSADNFVRMLIKRGHESVLEHVSLTFHIICNRAIMAELTRHRHASFTVESTRYVKYDELTFVAPFQYNVTSFDMYPSANKVFKATERAYKSLHDVGYSPENIRCLLPMALKSELYMTANLRSWRHILKLRTDEAAHPQMRRIANQILAVFKDKLPVIVEDIGK